MRLSVGIWIGYMLAVLLIPWTSVGQAGTVARTHTCMSGDGLLTRKKWACTAEEAAARSHENLPPLRHHVRGPLK